MELVQKSATAKVAQKREEPPPHLKEGQRLLISVQKKVKAVQPSAAEEEVALLRLRCPWEGTARQEELSNLIEVTKPSYEGEVRRSRA
mmetsp:Transcript_23042/g.53771  ORF Transcript_23042/g.53771 Transcript_23042/m.53771 type:complete len:88 (+) Transcript_23042:181-444(+)